VIASRDEKPAKTPPPWSLIDACRQDGGRRLAGSNRILAVFIPPTDVAT
jgi:hypothetical protein